MGLAEGGRLSQQGGRAHVVKIRVAVAPPSRC